MLNNENVHDVINCFAFVFLLCLPLVCSQFIILISTIERLAEDKHYRTDCGDDSRNKNRNACELSTNLILTFLCNKSFELIQSKIKR